MKDTKAHIFYLHIFVLAAFALAQPLYDLIRQYPTFLVAHDVGPAQLLLFVALISFGIPLALVAVQFAAGAISPTLRLRIQLVLVFVLSTLIFSPVLKKVYTGQWLFVFALIAGGMFTFGYCRVRSLRTLVTYLSPAVLVFPALFLFTGSVASVLSPQTEQVTKGVPIESTPPIVYIIFDEFSSVSLMDKSRNIDADRFPNFAAFANDAYWCRNATTNASATRFAVPALLTGTFPPPDVEMLPILKNYPRNLFTLLHEHYAYNIKEPLTELCPDSNKQQSEEEDVSFNSFMEDIGLVYLHVISPDGVSEKLPSVSHNWAGFLEGENAADYDNDHVSWSGSVDSTMQDWRSKLKVVMKKPKKREAFRKFVASIPRQTQPSFNFYHCPFPHRPHAYLPSTRDYEPSKFRPAVNKKKMWVDDPARVEMAYLRYMLQLQFVDTVVGELVEELKKNGLYDRSLIILTSDHGVNHEPGEYRRILDDNNYDEILPVPLFIKLPGQKEGIIDDRNVESVDVVATILDVLGAEPDWALDGISILDQSASRRPQKTAHRGKLGITYYDPEFEEKYEALDRKLASFGTGRDPWALYRIGPYGDLVGKKLEEIPSARAAGKRTRLDRPDAWNNVRLTGTRVPVLITGKVIDRQPKQNAWPLAVSLNGVIVAVTNSYVSSKHDRTEKFMCLIPESELREGKNELDVFVISEDRRGNTRLERL